MWPISSTSVLTAPFFYFVTTVRVAETGASALAVGNLFTAWGLACMILTPLVGRAVTPGNCVAMTVVASGTMALSATASIVFPAQAVMSMVMAVLGASLAFFFLPFMVFMKSVESDGGRNLVASTATYTLAWSLGLGAGPFIAGWLWTYSWRYACNLDIVQALVTGCGLYALRGRIQEGAGMGIRYETGERESAASRPDMVRISWVATVVLFLALAAIRGLFPSGGQSNAIAKFHQGNTMALICLARAVVAFFLRNGSTWVYRALPTGLFGVAGLAGITLFGLAHTWPVYYLAATLTGTCTGAARIYFVYHAIVHPDRAGRYAGVNESIVGLTGILGPFVGGLMGDRFGLAAPHLAFALLFAAALCLQVVAHARVAVPAVR